MAGGSARPPKNRNRYVIGPVASFRAHAAFRSLAEQSGHHRSVEIVRFPQIKTLEAVPFPLVTISEESESAKIVALEC